MVGEVYRGRMKEDKRAAASVPQRRQNTEAKPSLHGVDRSAWMSAASSVNCCRFCWTRSRGRAGCSQNKAH